MLGARWGLIDDHEILLFIGPNAHLPFSRIYEAFSLTELNWNSGQSRYRPSYYFLRVFESVVWGKNPTLWYVTRTIISILLGIGIARISIRIAGPILSSGFLIFCLSPIYWADIFAKAGPSEVYAVLGCVLLAFTICTIQDKSRITSFLGLMIAIGVIIAAGAKENLLFVAVIPAYLLVSGQYKKTKWSILFMGISLAYTLFIVLILYLRLKGVGVDIYQNNTALNSRLNLLFSLMAQQKMQIWMASLAVSPVFYYFARLNSLDKNSSTTLLSDYFKFVKWGLLLIIIYVSQYIFYAGKWPQLDSRYYFPGVLALQFSILIGAFFLVKFLSLFNTQKLITTILKIIIAVSFVFLSTSKFSDNRNQALANSRMTAQFDQKFNSIIQVLKKNPNLPLVMVVHSQSDYEPIVAIYRFLYSQGITNSLGVLISGSQFDQKGDDPPQTKKLIDVVKDFSKNGVKSKPGEFRLDPIGTLDLRDCVSVGISGSPLADCKHGAIRIWN
jgi:hypothetical protein